jgi:hypothetical protein
MDTNEDVGRADVTAVETATPPPPDADVSPEARPDVSAGQGTAVDVSADQGAAVDAGTDRGTVVDAGADQGAAVDAGTDRGTVVDVGADVNPDADAGVVTDAKAETAGDAQADATAADRPLDGHADGVHDASVPDSSEDGVAPPSIVRAGRIGVGWTPACAVRDDGSLWCWGSGFLGDGTQVFSRPQPGPVPALGKTVAQVVCGDYYTMALTTDHSLWLWGGNPYGPAGDVTPVDHDVPWQFPELKGVTASVSGGYDTACAVKTDGTVWCWGSNLGGHLGNGTTQNSWTPVQAKNLFGAVEVSVGMGGAQVCARKADGSVWCWGPDPATLEHVTSPRQVVSLGYSAAQVAVGSATCVLKTDRSLWCWGFNNIGQVGDGTYIRRTTPVQVTTLGNEVAEVGAGGQHTCARKVDGSVWCWGNNFAGQLGDGTAAEHISPERVASLGNAVVELVTADSRNCARKTDGSIWCWGNSADGVFVDGQSHYVRTPVQITFPP